MHVRLCQGCYEVVTRLLQPSFFYMGLPLVGVALSLNQCDSNAVWVLYLHIHGVTVTLDGCYSYTCMGV